MKRGLLVLFALMIMLALTTSLSAEELTCPTSALVLPNGDIFSTSTNLDAKTTLLPDGRNLIPDELDRTWEDSIYYFLPGNYQSLNTGTNYWSATRFTAPADFSLQGIRFCTLNQNTNDTDECEVYVYSDDDGTPGDALNNGDPVFNDILPPWSDNWPSNWQEVDFDDLGIDYIEFNTGDDFWIMYGPAPGGTYDANHGWWNLMDSGLAPGNRSKLGTNRDGDTWNNTGGDLFIVAEGEVSEFWDLGVLSIYNDLDRFFYHEGTEVTFSARIANLGNVDAPAVEVVFTVEDADGEEVFNETVDLEALDAEDETTVDADVAWTPDAEGYYYAYATLEGDELGDDADAMNNSYALIQGVVAVTDWYYYDDGSVDESGLNFGDSTGCAVGFTPAEYPAQIDSAMWNFVEAHTNCNLQVWTLIGNTMYEGWSGTENCEEGWNTFAVPGEDGEPVSTTEGMFIVMYIDSGIAYFRDIDPPNAAENPDMHAMSFSASSGGNAMGFSEAGNWAFRGLIGQGVAPEIVFPNTTVDFGEVMAGESGFADLGIVNNGTGVARIDSIRIGGNIADVVAVVDDLPYSIDPGEEGAISIEWVPPDENSNLAGGLLVYHNDHLADNPQLIQVIGTAMSDVEEIAGGIPAEYFLSQNFPNPFNPVTDIRFGLKADGHVRLAVYNVMGQEVVTLVDQAMTAGVHHAAFDAASMASGIYYYSIEVNNFRSLRKMALIR